MANRSVSKYLGSEKKVRGYAIKRMPVGAYMKALARIQEMPADFMESVFPGQSIADVLKVVGGALQGTSDSKALMTIVSAFVANVPEYAITLASDLLDIPTEQIMTDPVIGLDGLLEMMEAWVEINGIMDFIRGIKRVGGLLLKTKPAMKPPESESSSQSVKSSESQSES